MKTRKRVVDADVLETKTDGGVWRMVSVPT